MKGYSLSLTIRKMKKLIDVTLHLLEWVLSKRQLISSIKDMEGGKFLYPVSKM